MTTEEYMFVITLLAILLALVIVISSITHTMTTKMLLGLRDNDTYDESEENREDVYIEPDYTIKVYDRGNHITINGMFKSYRDWDYYANDMNKDLPIDQQVSNALKTYFGWP